MVDVGSVLSGFCVTGIASADDTAVVYRAADDSGQHLVLTIGRHPLSTAAERAEFFEWSGRVGALAGNPAFVTLRRAALADGDLPYVATDEVAPTLADRLIDGSGPLSGAEVRSVGVAVAEALVALHAVGLVHGLVGPTTVTGGSPARLGGLAMTAPPLAATAPSSAFTAPEHLEAALGGRFAASAAGDVYGLGALLYIAAGGRVPWRRMDGAGRPNASLRTEPLPETPGLSPGLLTVLRQATAFGSQDRPDARQLRDALEAADPAERHAAAGTTAKAPVGPSDDAANDVDTATVRSGRLRETAATAAVSAGVTTLTTELLDVAKAALSGPGTAAGATAGGTTAAGATATGAAGTGSAAGTGVGSAAAGAAGTSPAAGSAGTGALITSKALVITVLSTGCVAAGAGVGGYQAYRHFTCAGVRADKSPATVLNNAVHSLETTGLHFTAKIGSDTSLEGSYDGRGPLENATVRVGGQAIETRIDHTRGFVRDPTTGTWSEVSVQQADRQSNNPIRTAEVLKSSKRTASSHCNLTGTLSPAALSLPPGTRPIPFQAAIDSKGRLTHISYVLPHAAIGEKADVAIDLRFSSFGTPVHVTRPRVG
jgi:hypothetical protein